MEAGTQAVWRCLADPTRWRIIEELAAGPRTTGALASLFTQSRFAVMKHLDVLTEAGLVLVERRGRERWNHLNAAPLVHAVDTVTTPLVRHWASSLSLLRNELEEDPMPPDQTRPDQTRPDQTPHDRTPDDRTPDDRTRHDRTSPDPMTSTGTIAGDEPGRPTSTAPPASVIDIRQQIRVAAAPDRVVDVLTTQIDRWWAPSYRMTAGGRMRFDARPGGELREEDAHGHVAVWGRVEEIALPRLIVLAGTFGMRDAVTGRVRIDLTAQDAATILTLEHRALGVMANDTQPLFTEGWRVLLDGLRSQAEQP